MTFLSPLLRDTGTIFRIPKRMTFLWFMRTRGEDTALDKSACRLQRFGKAESILRTAVEQLTKAMMMQGSLVA